jgi:hypothetical protein
MSWSFGDTLAAIELVNKIVQALRQSGSDEQRQKLEHFHSLLCFTRAIIDLGKAAYVQTGSDDQLYRDSIEMHVKSLDSQEQELLKKLAKYHKMEKGASEPWVAFLQRPMLKLKWAFFEQDDVVALKNDIFQTTCTLQNLLARYALIETFPDPGAQS